MSQRKLVATAVVTSLVVHTAGLVAFATWSAHAVRSRAQFAGKRKAIELTVSFDEPQWSPELSIVASTDPEPPVVIEPKEARIAKRRYVQSPAGELPLADFLADAAIDINPTLRKRADRNDVPAWPSEDTYPHSTAVKRQALARISPALTPVEPPSSLGNAEHRPPDLSQNSPPNYPQTAIQRRWEGTVLLRIRIDETGKVTDVEIARSSGYPVLDGAAATAVKRWTGFPAIRGGEPAATVELLPVRFRLGTR